VIKIFVGCAANHDDAESQMVLEHSLRSRSSSELEITWMKLSRVITSPFYSERSSGWQTQLWATPFSGFRWAVPELCSFQGRAIYMDSDCVALSDIADLWSQAFLPGKVVMAKGGEDSWRYCVALWDCEAARAQLPSVKAMMADRMAHKNLMTKFKENQTIVQPFEGNWNCVDGEDYSDLSDPAIKVLHYSSEAHQPHLKYAVPRMTKAGRRHWFDGRVQVHWRRDVIDLFEREYQAALNAGYRVEDYTKDPVFGTYDKASQANYRTNRWGAAGAGR
jgi:hypothetical protein